VTDLRVVAVDLGATSGRIMVGTVGRTGWNSMRCTDSQRTRSRRHHQRVPAGLGHPGHLPRDAGRHRGRFPGGRLDGIGIDSWAVDFGLLASDGSLLGNPVSYRDARTEGVMERVLTSVTRQEMYEVTGLQQLPFNTIYQLVSALGTPQAGCGRDASADPRPAGLLAYRAGGGRGHERLYYAAVRRQQPHVVHRSG
jgi:rhamnulokinase